MHIEEIIAKIKPINKECVAKAQARFDALIKPVGSLAKLELMTTQYAGIIGKYDKQELSYPKCAILVWSDFQHADQVEQLMREALPVNILAQETKSEVYPLLVMAENIADAYEEGSALVQELINSHKLNLVAFASLTDGSDKMVQKAMLGGMLQAAAMQTAIMLDGVAAGKALEEGLEKTSILKEYCMAGHVSAEPGAEELLQELELEAPLRLDIPDGAGEGAAVAFTLVNAGIRAYKEMETFAEAGVHDEMKEFSRKEEMSGSHWKQL